MPTPANPSLWHRWLPQLLVLVLIQVQLPAAQPPQQVAPAPQANAQPPAPNTAPLQPLAQLPVEQSLQIRVLAGKDEVNDLQNKVMAPIVVQVVDVNQRPVEGAEVVFRFPLTGPSAAFTGGKSSQTTRTNSDGQAAATNWTANAQTGRFQIHVSASYGNQVGETTFSMTNATRVEQEGPRIKRTGWWSHPWAKAIVIGAAGGIAAGIFLATRGGGRGSGGPTVVISPGSPSIGGPH